MKAGLNHNCVICLLHLTVMNHQASKRGNGGRGIIGVTDSLIQNIFYHAQQFFD